MSSFQGTAAVYCRISRDVTGEGEGVERQEEACRRLAEQLHLSVASVYSDNDIGASNRTGAKPRPGYEAMLEAVRRGEVSTIISYSNSRLTRRPKEWLELIALAEVGKLKIKTVVSGSHDLTTADGRAVALTVAAWDSAEADRISERQKATFQRRAFQGKPKIQRQRPFGWEVDGVTLRESEASLVRAAVEKLKAGASITEIRREWEAAGVLTAAGGAVWEHGALKRVLVGWRTAGVRTYKREPLLDADGQLVRGLWEPIISLEDRELALAMLSRRSLKKKRQGKWLLSGIVRCAVCGGSMYGQLNATPTYVCKPGSGHLAITAAKLEEYVQRATLSRLSKRLSRENAEKVEVKPSEWPEADRLVTVGRKIAELMEAYNADTLSAQIVFAQVDRLEAERKELLKDRERHYSEQAPSSLPMRRSSELLEWALDLLTEPVSSQDSFDSFGDSSNDEGEDLGGPWGGSLVSQEMVKVAPDPDEAEKQRIIRGEIEEVIIKRGPRGRAGWGMKAFEQRVEIRWRE